MWRAKYLLPFLTFLIRLELWLLSWWPEFRATDPRDESVNSIPAAGKIKFTEPSGSGIKMLLSETATMKLPDRYKNPSGSFVSLREGNLSFLTYVKLQTHQSHWLLTVIPVWLQLGNEQNMLALPCIHFQQLDVIKWRMRKPTVKFQKSGSAWHFVLFPRAQSLICWSHETSLNPPQELRMLK